MIARAAVALALTLALPQFAWAHPPPLGIGGFPGGLLHPLFVPAHAMTIVALGLLAGRQAGWTSMAGLSFAKGMAAGLFVMTLGIVPVLMNEVVLGIGLIAGLLVAWGRPVPELAGGIIAVFAGFCIALDSPPEAISLTEANLMLVGTGLGALALLIVVTKAAAALKAGWMQIGARVLGSWIAAGAILVLVLRFVR